MKNIIIGLIMLCLGYANINTNKIIQNRIEYYINKYSKEYKIEKALIKAIIKQESNFKPFSIRYEPKLKKAEWYNSKLTETEKNNKLCYCSVGLMQILYLTAKTQNFKGDPEDLLKIENMEYSIKYLKYLINRYYYIDKVIVAYNAGSPKRTKEGDYINQDYLDSVKNNYKTFGGVIEF